MAKSLPTTPVEVSPLVEFFAAALHALFGVVVVPGLLGIATLGSNVTQHAWEADALDGALAGLTTFLGCGFGLLAGLHSFVAAWAWLSHAAVPHEDSLARAVRQQAWTLRWTLTAGIGAGLGCTALMLRWSLS